MTEAVRMCVKMRGGGKTFPVLYCSKTGGNKHTYRLQLRTASVCWKLASGIQHKDTEKEEKNTEGQCNLSCEHLHKITQAYVHSHNITLGQSDQALGALRRSKLFYPVVNVHILMTIISNLPKSISL